MAENSRELKTISTAKENKSNPYSKDVIVDPMGQWKHPGKVTKIPSNNITMKGVPYPVLGVDNLGNIQMMMPGGSYVFAGSSVTEYPMMQKGGVWGTPEQMYNDSLNLWKAYQYQKAHSEPAYKKWLEEMGAHYPGGPEALKKAREKNLGKPGTPLHDKDAKKSHYIPSADESTYSPLYKEEKPIVDFYKSLKFSGPTRIGMHSSPDLWHKYIAPIGSYMYDAKNPIYKKPVYDPSKQTPKVLSDKEPVETLAQDVVDYLERKPAPMFQVNQQEQEVIIPKQAAKQDTSNMRIAWRMDPDVKKMVPVIGEKNQPVSKAKRIYNKDVPTASAAIPVDFIPEYDAPPSFQIGGWLDKYEQDEFRLGGFSREALKRTSRKSTSKNIQSSINKLFLRNEDLFGPSGKRVYDPKSKKQEGGQANGWLDKYDGL